MAEIRWTSSPNKKQPAGKDEWVGYYNKKGRRIMELRHRGAGVSFLVKISRGPIRSYRFTYDNPVLRHLNIRISQNGVSQWTPDTLTEMHDVIQKAVQKYNSSGKLWQIEGKCSLKELYKVMPYYDKWLERQRRKRV